MRVIEKHLLHTWVENNRRHWALVARIGPSLTAMGVCKVYLHAMDSLGFIFLLCLNDQLLQDIVVPSHHAT